MKNVSNCNGTMKDINNYIKKIIKYNNNTNNNYIIKNNSSNFLN